MPAFLIQILITLAVRFGMAFILKRFPGIPPEVLKIIEDLLENLKLHKEEKKALVDDAKLKVAACYGPTCEIPKE